MDWDKIPFFECEEFDDPLHEGSGDNISREVILTLVGLRHIVGCPIIIHGKVGGAVDMDGSHGHAGESLHLFKNGCKAVDFHLKCNWDARSQAYYILNSGFSGIGMYDDWHWDNKKLTIGFHGDIRDKSKSQVWYRDNGKYIYFLQ